MPGLEEYKEGRHGRPFLSCSVLALRKAGSSCVPIVIVILVARMGRPWGKAKYNTTGHRRLIGKASSNDIKSRLRRSEDEQNTRKSKLKIALPLLSEHGVIYDV